MRALKSLARRLAVGRSITRRLPASVGSARIVVSPESQLKYFKPGRSGFDSLLLHWAENHVRSGMNVWDIGANVGVFSFAAAGRGAAVLAIEADPAMGALLLRSARLNPTLAVSVLSIAVADRQGFATLQIASGGRASNSLTECVGTRSPFGYAVGEVEVATTTLDGLIDRFGAPDLIKLDIEGAEEMALHGAERILANVRPRILIELGEQMPPGIGDLFKRHRYSLANADPKGGNILFNALAEPS